MQNKIFGLIGKPIKHSFSKKYFEEKFDKLHLTDCEYRLFELESIKDLPKLIGNTTNLQGFNVTSPYKIQILDHLYSISQDAFAIGAVNTVKIENGKLTGYNTDWKGFLKSLMSNVDVSKIQSALILGTGGAAKSVAFALNTQNISYIYASTRSIFNDKDTISYSTLNRFENFEMFDLIVNATPCGMEHYPLMVDINTNKITKKHVVFDLIYNPNETLLLKEAKNNDAKIINGLEMLHNQAEESWKIWTKNNNPIKITL